MEFADMIPSPKIDGVILHSPFHEPMDGTLCITGHHLIISSRKEGVQELWLLHKSIDNVDKKLNNSNPNFQNGGVIILKCKDLRILTLEINSTEELFNVYEAILNLYDLSNPEKLYPFFYRPMYNILEDGHTLFKPELEYSKLISSDEWRLTHINRDYSVCPTYSSVLVVPKSIDDDTIRMSAAFREGGRFPIISYRHENGAVLLRSSQPLLANSTKRCVPDEKLLNAMLNDKKGYIVDTRSVNLANQCKTKGGGYEPDSNYRQWKRIHKALDKISNCSGSLLDSFAKLVEACNDKSCTPDKWLSRLDNSGWLSHVLNVLSTACLVAQCLDQEGTPVLVHGIGGFDSTLLITSLVQVILNPDCRTVRGLQALVDREWLQAGHPFETRHSHSCYSTAQSGRSKSNQPTFLLFLDCVYQLYHQFPCSFEFTTSMLILIFEHSYFSQFGTFVGNCEADRNKLQVAKRTTSLWSYLNRPEVLTSLLNPMYEPNRTAIWPSVAPISIVLWNELYLRWILDQTNHKRTLSKIQALIQHDKNLRSKVNKLRKQLVDLQREYDGLNAENDEVEA